ncbi:MAG: protein kinase domain-containing protein [Thermoanaerobaculia bacterium]
MQLEPGAAVGPYEIVSLLGAGGMGEVYEATDRRLGRRVAVKVLSARSVAKSDALDRFQREARAVAALSHPNVVTLFDVGTAGEFHFVVTELLEGDTLRAHLDRPLEIGRAIEIATAIADGLAAAHAKRIVHRDLKPENVFLTTSGSVKILDFGLARLDELLATELDGAATLLKTPDGVVLGTVAYMAPEQVRGESADTTADVFALGAILHEMITGARPFGRATAAETMHAILKDPPPRLPGRRSKLLRNLEDLLLDCLAKDPAVRPATAGDVAERLRHLDTARGATRRVVASAGKRRSVAVLPFAAAAPEEESVAALLADTVRNRLAENPKLRVAARSAVQRFAGTDSDAQSAGRDLGASLAVSGDVRRIGSSLHVHVELVDVADASQIWGERWIVRDTDPRAADAAAEEIARALQPRLAGEPRTRPRRQKSGATSESLQLISTARAQLDMATPESIPRAASLLRDAVAREASAAAMGVLAEAETALAVHGLAPPAEVRDGAIDAAERALAMEASSPDALAAASGVRLAFLWDTASAEALARSALAEDPSHSGARLRLAECLVLVDRAAAIAEIDAAVAGTSPAPSHLTAAAWVAYLARDSGKAIALCHRAIVANPDVVRARAILALALAAAGQAADAIRDLQRDARSESVELETALAVAYALGGKRAGAAKIAERLATPGRPHYVPPLFIARIHAALNDTAAAEPWLQRAVTEGSPHAVHLSVEPVFAGIRDDSRLGKILTRVRAGFPATSS